MKSLADDVRAAVSSLCAASGESYELALLRLLRRGIEYEARAHSALYHETNICLECGDEFDASHHRKNTCSNECYQERMARSMFLTAQKQKLGFRGASKMPEKLVEMLLINRAFNRRTEEKRKYKIPVDRFTRRRKKHAA